MAKKMYYSEEEVIAKLGIGSEGLAKLIEEQKLRVFHDGPKQMFKADEVDSLAGPDSGESAEIELAPAPEAEVPPPAAPQAEAPPAAAPQAESPTAVPAPPGIAQAGPADTTHVEAAPPPEAPKEDTATSEVVSIFDEGDLEVEAASPMAKTSITPGVEEQVTLEGVGSGSGLLDLTRESDDTSLGEALDHIDMAGALDTALGAEPGTATASYAPPVEAAKPAAAVAQVAAPIAAAPTDPSAGLFGGLVVGACLLMLAMGTVIAATLLGIVPTFVEMMKNNLLIVLGASAGVVIISAVVGMFIGKSMGPSPQPAEQGES